MARKVLILDTSVLCCFLSVAGKETAGRPDDLWDRARIETLLRQEEERGSTFVLPLASIIETGNHIAQAPNFRFETAQGLAGLIRSSANEMTPWAAFTDQSVLWGAERLNSLAEEWPILAASEISIGDTTIKDVAEYYSIAGWEVEIVTSDEGLKAYEPSKPVPVPRRRL